MKYYLLLIAMTLPTFGQTTSPVFVSTLTETNASISLVIRNNAPVPMTAFLVKARLYDGIKPRMEIFKYMDIYVNSGSDHPLQVGESRVIPAIPPDAAGRLRPEIELQGALFSDGTRTGMASGLAILTGRRQRLSQDLDRYRVVLQQGWLAGGPAEALARINAERDTDRAVNKAQRLDIGLASVDDLVPHWLGRALTLDHATCDQACTDAAYDRTMNGFVAWKTEVSNGLQELSGRQGPNRN